MSTITITDIKEVRAGDRVTFRTKEARYHFAGETITATAVEDTDGELFVLGYYITQREIEFISAARDVPDLPTEPGPYRDRNGDVWLLEEGLGWLSFLDHASPEQSSPLTRLIPETELAEQRKKITTNVRSHGAYLTAARIAKRIEQGEF